MGYQEIGKTADEKMVKTTNVFKHELSSLKAGRANPQILDRVMVDYYGTPTPISQVGNISAPEPRVMVISLWDQGMMHEVEKAIQKSDLGINPTNDGKVIRLVVPELTEERRKDLVKVVHKLAEEARVSLRAIRRDANDHLKKDEKAGNISEDELKRGEAEVQKMTDKHVKSIDDLCKEKEKEILNV